jgi:hypothetical protein
MEYEMVAIKLEGGIGNQMFQYAAARALASKLDSPLLLDIYEYRSYEDRQFDLHMFPNITESFLSEAQYKKLNSRSFFAKLRRALGGCRIYKEPYFHFNSDFFDLTEPAYLIGYFQSEKYFSEHESLIRKKFEWGAEKLSQTTLSYLSSLRDNTTVSVHFRRGDYVNNQKTSNYHGTCSPAYYQNSIALMAERNSDAHFMVFSDDIPWVKSENVFANLKHTYVEKTVDMHDSEEMFLMSQCTNNIVANSSFSWWGAWLNSYPAKVVVAPKNWFRTPELDTKDLVPESWLRI